MLSISFHSLGTTRDVSVKQGWRKYVVIMEWYIWNLEKKCCWRTSGCALTVTVPQLLKDQEPRPCSDFLLPATPESLFHADPLKHHHMAGQTVSSASSGFHESRSMFPCHRPINYMAHFQSHGKETHHLHGMAKLLSKPPRSQSSINRCGFPALRWVKC